MRLASALALGALSCLLAAPASAQLRAGNYGPAGRWQPPFAMAGPSSVGAVRGVLLTEPGRALLAADPAWRAFAELNPSSKTDRLLLGALSARLPAAFTLAELVRARDAAAVDMAMHVGARAAELTHLLESGALEEAEFARAAEDLRAFGAYGASVGRYGAALGEVLRARRSMERARETADALRSAARGDLDRWLEAGPVESGPSAPAGRPLLETDRGIAAVAEYPARTFRSLERAEFEASRRGLATQQGHDLRPVMLRVLADAHERLRPDSPLQAPRFASARRVLAELEAEGAALLHRGLPRAQTSGFVLRWVETMDALLRSADPALTGDYHRKLGGPELPELTREGKGSWVFFSFADASEAALRRMRPSASYLLGLLEFPAFSADAAAKGPLAPTESVRPYVDGHFITYDEFVNHDAGHSAFKNRRDLWLFATAGESKRALVKRWAANAVRFEAELDALKAADPDLGKAAAELMFEVTHERGYQYHLPILRQQLFTDKWSQVVRRKFESGYWGDKVILTAAQAGRLEEARRLLLALSTRLLREENVGRLRELAGGSVTLKEWPSIETFRGRPTGIDFPVPGAVRVAFETGSGPKATGLYEIALAQVEVSPVPKLSAERVARLEALLAAHGGEAVPLRADERALYLIESVALNAGGGITATVRPYGPLGEGAPLELDGELLAPAEPGPGARRFSKVELLKLEQVLELMARGGAAEATITREPRELTGRIMGTDASGTSLLLETAGGVRRFPLEEVSLQPGPAAAPAALADELAADAARAQAMKDSGEPWLFLDGAPADGPGRRAAYLGLTADPVHRAHVAMADRLLAGGANEVVVVLGLTHVSKGGFDATLTARRLALARRAFAGRPNVRFALSASGRYLDFADAAARATPAAARDIALGIDNVEIFLSRNSREDLARFAESGAGLVVFARGPGGRLALDQALARHRNDIPRDLVLRFIDWSVDPLSSSLIRALAADGESAWERWVRPAAAALVRALGLYREPADNAQRLRLYRESGTLIDRLIARGLLKRPHVWLGFGPHRDALSNAKRPASYPLRAMVPDDKISWDEPFAAYAPERWTDPTVPANDETIRPGGWADPASLETSPELRSRKSLDGPLRFDADGRPLNPRGRTGVAGRGLLGRFGANEAGDPVVTRLNPVTGAFELLLVRRKGGRLALPGGMRDKTDRDGRATAQRELREEAGAAVDLSGAVELYRGYVDDLRNTDHAWVETSAYWRHLSAEEESLVVLKADPEETDGAAWIPVDETLLGSLYASHAQIVRRMLALRSRE